jgi:hypothetical protein
MSDESIMGEPHEMSVTDALDGILIDGQPVQRSVTIPLHMPAEPTTGLWCSPFAPGKGPESLKDKIENPYGYYTVTEG